MLWNWVNILFILVELQSSKIHLKDLNLVMQNGVYYLDYNQKIVYKLLSVQDFKLGIMLS